MERDTTPKLIQAKRFMARRDWVASRAELVNLGIDPTAIDTWLATERLIPVLQGVYAFGRDLETRRSAWRASLLATGHDAALSGLSACQLWNLVHDTRTIPAIIEVASSGRSRTRYQGRSPALQGTTIRVVHRDIDPCELRWSGGLRVTTPARALLDHAVSADPVALKFAFLEASRLGHFTRREVEHSLRRMIGRRGATKLRPLVSLWVPQLARTRSPMEGMFVLGWVPTGRPMPLVNARIVGYEVDFFFPTHDLVVELDGKSYHGDPLSRSRDTRKQRALEDAGMKVLRFGSDRVFEALPSVVAEVIQALELAEMQKITAYR